MSIKLGRHCLIFIFNILEKICLLIQIKIMINIHLINLITTLTKHQFHHQMIIDIGKIMIHMMNFKNSKLIVQLMNLENIYGIS